MTRADSTTSPALRVWLIILAAGLAAPLITWGAAESLRIDETGSGSSRGSRVPISPVVFTTRNGMVAIGILGATLGLGLGMAGGLIRGSAKSAATAGLMGLLLGAAGGIGAAKVLIPLYFRNYSGTNLVVPLLVHGGLWTAIAVPAGLAFAIGSRGSSRIVETLGYALLGALIATLIYECSGAVLFPNAQSDRPLPLTSGSRLFAHLVIGLILAGVLAFNTVRGRPSAGVAEPSVA